MEVLLESTYDGVARPHYVLDRRAPAAAALFSSSTLTAGAVGRSILAAAGAGRDAPMAHRPSGDLAAGGLWLPPLGGADTDSAGLCAADSWALLVEGAGVWGPAPGAAA